MYCVTKYYHLVVVIHYTIYSNNIHALIIQYNTIIFRLWSKLRRARKRRRRHNCWPRTGLRAHSRTQTGTRTHARCSPIRWEAQWSVERSGANSISAQVGRVNFFGFRPDLWFSDPSKSHVRPYLTYRADDLSGSYWRSKLIQQYSGISIDRLPFNWVRFCLGIFPSQKFSRFGALCTGNGCAIGCTPSVIPFDLSHCQTFFFSVSQPPSSPPIFRHPYRCWDDQITDDQSCVLPATTTMPCPFPPIH